MLERNGALVSDDAFRAFYLAQKRLGLSTASLNKYVQSLAHYCRYNGLDWKLPVHKKEYSKRRLTYTDEEINKILAIGVLKREAKTTPLLLKVLAYSAGRPSEICQLRQSQLDYQNDGITIAGTKTEKDRYVPLNKEMLDQLSRLPDRLFTATDATVRYALVARCKLLGINYRPPYCFRHSRITAWLNSGMDLATASSLAGNSPQVIMESYWHTSVAHLQRAINRDTLRRSLMTPDEKVREIAKLLEEMKNSFKLDEDQDLDVHLDQKTNQISFTVKVKKETKKSK